MAKLNQVGAIKDACDKYSDLQIAILLRVVAVALLTPLIGYFLEQGDNPVWDVIQDYRHSELLVFWVGCGFIASVEAIAWLLRLAFTNGTSSPLTRRCS